MYLGLVVNGYAAKLPRGSNLFRGLEDEDCAKAMSLLTAMGGLVFVSNRLYMCFRSLNFYSLI